MISEDILPQKKRWKRCQAFSQRFGATTGLGVPLSHQYGQPCSATRSIDKPLSVPFEWAYSGSLLGGKGQELGKRGLSPHSKKRFPQLPPPALWPSPQGTI